MRTKHVLALLLSALAARARLVPFALHLKNEDVRPDGHTRKSITVNGASRAPAIVAEKGDVLNVNVLNGLSDPGTLKSTSIHWHGLFQHETAAYDGTAFVSQCPITPNSSFQYTIATKEQSGTYWYHSHYSTQYCDGLRGPLIIYDPADRKIFNYDVDDLSTIITLEDWYPGPTQFINKGLKDGNGGLPPFPVATLINGQGRRNGDPHGPLSVIKVQAKRKYRFRIINMSCDSAFRFNIEGHKMTVIEADGILHKSSAVDSLNIYIGQRYSVIVHADRPVGNYWIRSFPFGDLLSNSTLDGNQNSAIFRYRGAPEQEPAPAQQILGKTLREDSLVPIVAPGAPGGSKPADIKMHFAISIDPTIGFMLNGVNYQSPTIPVLLQILSGARHPHELMPKNSVISLPRDKVVEVSISGGSLGSPHPFHLHGHAFDVVRSAGQTSYNYANPPRRDVVNIGNFTSDNVTFRFETNNPGPWLLHCHIDWHLALGLALVFAEDVPEQVSGSQKEAEPQAWTELCPKFNALKPEDR